MSARLPRWLCTLAGMAAGCFFFPMTGPAADPGGVNIGEVEAERCEQKIASVRREVLGRYEEALGEMQLAVQKAADLEGALTVRAERQRVTQEHLLTEKNLLAEPKALRALQQQTLAKLEELIMQLVQETLPRLVEHKKALTIAGKLDEAVVVRSAIERLQTNYLPLSRADPGTVVPAETLVLAYAADRARADKVYRGQRLTVRGVVGGFRQDPNDNKHYVIYLAGGSGGWVQCAFSSAEFRFREESQFNNTVLLLTPRANESAVVRIQKGQSLDVRGVCEGWDELVRLSKCDLAR
ncbi:MAG: hypothetical protein M3463_05660 [Verrucomicrobiota bacterium]|nr:hypothetical protein [Verrucomicrobiota bacterium]